MMGGGAWRLRERLAGATLSEVGALVAAELTDDGVEEALLAWKRLGKEAEAFVKGVMEGIDEAKALADRGEFRELRSMLRERLRVSQREFLEDMPALEADVRERLLVVEDALAGVERDRRMILERLEALGTDGLRLLFPFSIPETYRAGPNTATRWPVMGQSVRGLPAICKRHHYLEPA